MPDTPNFNNAPSWQQMKMQNAPVDNSWQAMKARNAPPDMSWQAMKARNGNAANGGGGGGSGTVDPTAAKKGKKKPVVDPPVTPQWTFQPNAYDQPPTGPGPASQYQVNLPRQPWMLNPMGQAPQPPTPQEQQNQQYYQQWASPYRT